MSTTVTLVFPDLTPTRARQFLDSALDNFEPQSTDPRWLRAGDFITYLMTINGRKA